MNRALPSILSGIIRDTRSLIQDSRRERPESTLKQFPLFSRSCLSLQDALEERSFSIIAEVKKASPSQGIIRKDFDPVAITAAYQKAGACAVSILTEPVHFRGNIEFLRSCRSHLRIPVLRKDFIMDPYQVMEAKAYGADAILLIAAILDKNQLSELQSAAQDLMLSVLVEVHDEHELDRINLDVTPIIGVNARDLNTFEVNLEKAIALLKRLPQECIKVAESGIRSPEDLIALKKEGIDAALIGESFMRADNPGRALATFISAIQ